MKRAIVFLAVVGCGGASAEGPLTVPVGEARPALVADLKHHAYCAGPDGTDARTHEEMFPRCDQPGVEYGQSWVLATYDEGGEVVKLERWEKYADPDRLQDRFNDLVAMHSKLGPPSDVAKAQMTSNGTLPPGTRTWVAFQEGASLVGVYLIAPQPPGYVNLLEVVIEAPQ